MGFSHTETGVVFCIVITGQPQLWGLWATLSAPVLCEVGGGVSHAFLRLLARLHTVTQNHQETDKCFLTTCCMPSTEFPLWLPLEAHDQSPTFTFCRGFITAPAEP